MVIRRFDVYLVNLDPTVGSEIQKTRPYLVISPNEMNRYLRTAIVAPMTTQGKPYPSRVSCKFRSKSGFIVLDQIRTVDSSRLVQRLGRIEPNHKPLNKFWNGWLKCLHPDSRSKRFDSAIPHRSVFAP